MIPKIIHYCWFGHAPKPRLVRRCIDSWKRYCPDYKIIEWNEDNCDFNSAPLFVQQAVAAKRWGFVPDYFRLKIIYENGGIYLDTDVEVVRSLDTVLDNYAFFGFHNGLVNLGQGFGAQSGSEILLELMKVYEEITFLQPDGTPDLRPCTVKETPVFLNHGLVQDNSEQLLDDKIHIYPKEYFDPANWGSFFVFRTRRTISIHHYQSSWYSKKDKNKLIRTKWKDFFIRLPKYIAYQSLGEKKYESLKKHIKRS